MSFKSIIWKERLSQWKLAREKLLHRTQSHEEIPDASDFDFVEEVDLQNLEIDDEIWWPLSRKVPLPLSKINPYRVTIFLRLMIVIFFLRYRFTHPVQNAHALWLASLFCEVWFSMGWVCDQLLKLQPLNRETYPERLCLRYNQPGKPSGLASIDVFIGTADPLKEPPLVTSNTVLSILSVDYPAEKVSCYVSDDGSALLTLETLSQTCEFARKWVPFCKKFNIEPRSPEIYFARKVDNLNVNIHSTFFKERRSMKRYYEEFKIQINGLIAKFQDVPSEGWILRDGIPWPGNNTTNHPGMIQIMMGSGGSHGSDDRSLPQLVYISREKRPGFQHNNKAGSMNALVRVSALLTNGTYILNLDCGHYINNSRAFLDAMCFMMDPSNKSKICYVQFPQKFNGIDVNDQYVSSSSSFYDINLKGLDGIQGPICVGTGCFFYRKALYGYAPPFEPEMPNTSWWVSSNKTSRDNRGHYSSTHVLDDSNSGLLVRELTGFEREFSSSFPSMEKCFGASPSLIASILEENKFSSGSNPESILREAIHVISCNYEDNTAWGREVGWIYGYQAGDFLTGFKMHARGWRSVYCTPSCAAFRGVAPFNLSERLGLVLLGAAGSIEVLFSRHCPIWYGYGGRLKLLERIAYISATIYPLGSIPLLIYSSLPAICLLTGKFIISPITYEACVWLMLILLSVLATGALEIRWSGVSIQQWRRNQQFWVIAGVSSHFLAVFQGLGKAVLGLSSSTSSVTAETELYAVKWSSLLILPMALILINLWAIASGVSSFFTSGYGSLGLLSMKVFFAVLVVVHLRPFLTGFLISKHRVPTIVMIWSVLIAAMFSMVWVWLNPYTTRFHGPDIQKCGILC